MHVVTREQTKNKKKPPKTKYNKLFIFLIGHT